MKLKLDENLGRTAADILQSHVRNVQTIRAEGLSQTPDRDLIRVCKSEQQCLVTLDMDFGNPLLFNAADYAGIALLRLPPRPSHADMVEACQTLALGLENRDITGKLWIVYRRRIREYQSEDRP